MTLIVNIIVFACLVCLVLLSIWLLIRYQKYQETTDYKWRKAFVSKYKLIQLQLKEHQSTPADSDSHNWYNQLLNEYRQRIPIDRLKDFPGIGPATVDRLSGMGFRSIGHLLKSSSTSFASLGPSRSDDVIFALKRLHRETRENFDNGNCPEAKELAKRKTALEQKLFKAKDLAQIVLQIEPDLRRRLEPFVQQSRRASFWNFLLTNGVQQLNDDIYSQLVPGFDLIHDLNLAVQSSVLVNKQAMTVAVFGESMEKNRPAAFEVVLSCRGCNSTIRASSSKQRTHYRITCPKCQTEIVVDGYAATPLPVAVPVVQPVSIPPKPQTQPVNSRPLPSATVVPVAQPLSNPNPVQQRSSSTSVFARGSVPPPSPPLLPVDPFLFSPDTSYRAVSLPTATPEQIRKITALARVGFAMAWVDGTVAKAEKTAIRQFLIDLFGHQEVLLRQIDPILETVQSKLPSTNICIQDVVDVTTQQERKSIYAAIERVADACGPRNASEVQLLQQIHSSFGLASLTSTTHDSPQQSRPIKEIRPTLEPQPTPSVTAIPAQASVPQAATPSPVNATIQVIANVTATQLEKIMALSRLGYAMAWADGKVANAEVSTIRQFLLEFFGKQEYLLQYVDPIMENTKSKLPSDEFCISSVTAITSEQERFAIYAGMERIADASGQRKPKEVLLLDKIRSGFGLFVVMQPSQSESAPWGINQHKVETAVKEVQRHVEPPVILPQQKPTPINHRSVLDIDGTTQLTPELIRRKFNGLSDRIDLAKASALGQEFETLARQKLIAARHSAEVLLAPFGVPLELEAKPAAPADIRHNPDLDDIFGA